jgi:hypothetical protein
MRSLSFFRARPLSLILTWLQPGENEKQSVVVLSTNLRLVPSIKHEILPFPRQSSA